MTDHVLMAEEICPECHQGKHGNCWGDTWDMYADRPAVCPCWAGSGARAGEHCQRTEQP